MRTVGLVDDAADRHAYHGGPAFPAAAAPPPGRTSAQADLARLLHACFFHENFFRRSGAGAGSAGWAAVWVMAVCALLWVLLLALVSVPPPTNGAVLLGPSMRTFGAALKCVQRPHPHPSD